MKGNFSEIIKASVEWTKTILFRPFDFKKWCFLFIISLFAFQLHGGCNSSFNSSSNQPSKKSDNIQQEATKPLSLKEGFENFVDEKGKNFIFSIIGIICLVIISLYMLFTWLYSIFSFIFIESIINNDASIKKPFKKNKSLGNSFFGWNICCFIIFIGILIFLTKLSYSSLLSLGIFEEGGSVPFGKIAFTLLPYILTVIIIMVLGFLLSFFISNFALVIMYKDRTSILNTLPKAFSLIRLNLSSSIKFMFVKFGLWIITSLMSSMISFFISIALMIPIIIIPLLLVAINKAIPEGIETIFTIAAFTIGIPIFIALAFLVGLIYLPFGIFHKTFSLKFIARIDEDYNLFSFVK